MNMKTFGKRLKEVRENKNVSAVELAEAIHVNPATIHRYEKAEFKSIKESRLEAIAEYLSVNKDYLCGKSNEQYDLHTLENLSTHQNIEINTIIYLTKELIQNDNVTLEGKPVEKPSIDYLIDTMDVALEILKRKNK